MKKCIGRIGIAVMLSALAFLPLFGNTEDEASSLRKTFNVSAGGSLTITSDIGSIDVRSAAGNTVDVDVQIGGEEESRSRLKSFLRDFEVDFQQTGNDVIVTADYHRDGWIFDDWFGRHVRVRFLVTVPLEYNVVLKTSGGSISVSDLHGSVRANTSGGSLKFGAIQGPVIGKTSGGSIRLEASEGNAELNTSGGSIHLGEVKGDVRAHTSGGSIEIRETSGTVDASTSGGFINAALTEQPKGNCRLTTSGGSITVTLAERVGIYVDASTSGGHVSTDFPITVQGEIDKHHLRAEINGGGPDLYLRTSGGSIHLKRM